MQRNNKQSENSVKRMSAPKKKVQIGDNFLNLPKVDKTNQKTIDLAVPSNLCDTNLLPPPKFPSQKNSQKVEEEMNETPSLEIINDCHLISEKEINLKQENNEMENKNFDQDEGGNKLGNDGEYIAIPRLREDFKQITSNSPLVSSSSYSERSMTLSSKSSKKSNSAKSDCSDSKNSAEYERLNCIISKKNEEVKSLLQTHNQIATSLTNVVEKINKISNENEWNESSCIYETTFLFFSILPIFLLVIIFTARFIKMPCVRCSYKTTLFEALHRYYNIAISSKIPT